MTARSYRSVGAQIILYTALIAGTGNPILAQNQSNRDTSAAVVRGKIEALLGGYEHAASPDEWRSLGSAAPAILADIAGNQNALPTRRARSLEGLASFGGSDTTLFDRLAKSEQEPLLVRMSAVRGLGRLLPESPRLAALRPLLKSANPQLRGVVAEVLAQSPTGCEEVRAQASLETEAWRSRFTRGCVAPGASDGKAATGPANLSAGTAEPMTAAAATSGGQYIIPLGSFAVFTNQLSSPITVNLPATAISSEFIGQPADPTARVVVYRIIDPDGVTIFNYASQTNIAKILPASRPGSFSVLLPNSPTVPFKPGPWTFYLLGAKATTADVQAVYKTSLASAIDVNLFFVGVPNLSAKSAPTDPNFQTILSTVRSIYSQVGVTLGNLTYIDIMGKDATTFTDVIDSEFGSLLQLSSNPQAGAAAINIFLVHSLSGSTLNGFIILGESGGIPGTPVRGSTGSGVAFTLADFPNGLDELGRTMAHEIGHWLGLFHTTESGGTAFDPLPDTPECPQVPFDTDGNGIMEPPECITRDATNLMFWTDFNSIPATVLTPDQGFVMLRNPIQNADFAALKVPPFPP